MRGKAVTGKDWCGPCCLLYLLSCYWECSGAEAIDTLKLWRLGKSPKTYLIRSIRVDCKYIIGQLKINSLNIFTFLVHEKCHSGEQILNSCFLSWYNTKQNQNKPPSCWEIFSCMIHSCFCFIWLSLFLLILNQIFHFSYSVDGFKSFFVYLMYCSIYLSWAMLASLVILTLIYWNELIF